jgi:signal peptide peptidase SppA
MQTHTLWAMMPEALAYREARMRQLGTLTRSDAPKVLASIYEEYERAAETASIYGQVAVVDIIGPVMRMVSGFDLWLYDGGVTSWDLIQAQLASAIEQNAKAIVLNIDSPGGVAHGPTSVAETINMIAESMPVVSFTSGSMTSAALWVGVAGSEVVATADAIVGSIGAVMTIVDTSKLDSDLGIEVIQLVNDDSPAKRSYPLDDEVLANLQALVNNVADIFINDVATYRGVSRDTVTSRYGQGGVITGQEALQVGLVDRRGVSLSQEVARLNGL